MIYEDGFEEIKTLLKPYNVCEDRLQAIKKIIENVWHEGINSGEGMCSHI